MDPRVEDLLRELAPQVLGALVRRYGHFDTAEDAVQEAMLDAAESWREAGLPEDPRAWLIRVAGRRLTDLLRAEQARRRREETQAVRVPREAFLAPGADAAVRDADDSLVLLLLCCHPALSGESQIALALRAVGGLTTQEIASAFLVPPATMGQRISRAKKQIKASGLPFRLPPLHERAARLDAVEHVLYLIFNEGYTASSGAALDRPDLAAEAIRLTRMLHAALPDDGEVSGLLALMLLIHARRDARTTPDGAPIPLADQDRARWDRDLITEGTALVTAAMGHGPPGRYRLQAAIAALHDEAERPDDTDWPQILALYRLLEALTNNPVIRINTAVAAAMVHGPRAGLTLLEPLESEPRLAGSHRLQSVRAHLLESAGDLEAAERTYRAAAALAPTVRSASASSQQ
jgi:RNA polymerase sigma factor (sigma-70 family)